MGSHRARGTYPFVFIKITFSYLLWNTCLNRKSELIFIHGYNLFFQANYMEYTVGWKK